MANQKDVLQWNVQGSRGAIIIMLEAQDDGTYKEASTNSRFYFDLIGDSTEMKSPAPAGADNSAKYIEFTNTANTTYRIAVNAKTKTLQSDGTFKEEIGSGGEAVFPEITLQTGNTPLVGTEKTRLSLPAWIKAKLKLQKTLAIIGVDMGKLVGEADGHSTGWLLGRIGEVGASLKSTQEGEVLTFKGTNAQLKEINFGSISFKNLDKENITLHAPQDLTNLQNGDFDLIEGA